MAMVVAGTGKDQESANVHTLYQSSQNAFETQRGGATYVPMIRLLYKTI